MVRGVPALRLFHCPLDASLCPAAGGRAHAGLLRWHGDDRPGGSQLLREPESCIIRREPQGLQDGRREFESGIQMISAMRKCLRIQDVQHHLSNMCENTFEIYPRQKLSLHLDVRFCMEAIMSANQVNLQLLLPLDLRQNILGELS